MDSNRRITEKLLRYWLSLRGSKPFPAESEIDKSALADIWDSCFLVKIAEANHYVYLGKKLLEAFGGDMTNYEIAMFLTSPFTTHIEEKFAEVAKTRKPVDDQETKENSRKAKIKYRLALLPLAGINGKIDH